MQIVDLEGLFEVTTFTFPQIPMDDSLPEKIERFMNELMSHQRRLYQYIHALLPRQQDAEDVMQNTLLVLWRKFDQFQPTTSFYTWARNVAFREICNFRRRNKREVTIFDDSVFEQIAAEIEQQTELLEARHAALLRCAEKLSLSDRELLHLRYTLGTAVKEIAQRLGRPANSVCKSLSRIRQALWDCINEELAAEEQKAAEEKDPFGTEEKP